MEKHENNYEIKRTLDLIKSNFFNSLEPGIFDIIFDDLISRDRFCVLADFQSYLDKQAVVSSEYLNKKLWTTKSIYNTARSGKFSSDRTIKQYADEIWKIYRTPVNI